MKYINPKNWTFTHYATFFVSFLMLPENIYLFPLALGLTLTLGTFFVFINKEVIKQGK